MTTKYYFAKQPNDHLAIRHDTFEACCEYAERPSLFAHGGTIYKETIEEIATVTKTVETLIKDARKG